MWMHYKNGQGPKKKKRQVNELVRLPSIGGSALESNCQDPQISRPAVAQRRRQLPFSSCLRNPAPQLSHIKTTAANHKHTVYAGLVVETELEITAHLRQCLQQRHAKPQTQMVSVEWGEWTQNVLKDQTNLSKDGVRQASTHGLGHTTHLTEGLPQSSTSPEEEETSKEAVEKEDPSPNTELNMPFWISSGAQVSVLREDLPAGEEEQNDKCCREHPEAIPVPQVHAVPQVPKKSSVLPSPVKQRRFMLYLCGGYSDSVAERSALIEHAYPQLYLSCRQRGYDLRMVDLRRGVGDPVSDRHDTAQLHVETLRRCQEADGPNFFVFVGQKHEVQTLPDKISQEAFEAIVRVVEKERKKLSMRNRAAATGDDALDGHSSIATSSAESVAPEQAWSEPDRTGSSGLRSRTSISQNSLSDAEETTRLSRRWMDSDRDMTLLRMWYQLDENRVPAVYQLLPVSTHHPDFLSRDGQRRKLARKAWQASCARLWAVLHRNGPEAVGEEVTSELLRTVLDREVEQGLGPKGLAEQSSHCYKRVIPDLLDNLRSEYAPHFIDLHKGRPEINQTLHAAHQSLLHDIHKKLRHTNIYETSVGWGKKGLSPKHNRSHQFYTERLCSRFLRTVNAALDRVIEVDPVKSSFDVMRREGSRRRLGEGILHHVRHGQALEQGCVLRQSFLMEVLRALEESHRRPILLLGDPGWGKSTTLARVVQFIPTWIPGDVQVLVCFVGLTGESRNVRLVLHALCWQLTQSYSNHTEPSEGLGELAGELLSLLGQATEARPVALVLDALDELSEDHEAHLSWLCSPLPPHVYMVLSACTHSPCAQTLQGCCVVLSLPPLSAEDISSVLSSRLEAEGRRLTEVQWGVLLQACLSCPSPLYLETACHETQPWRSYSPTDSLALPGELRALYQALLTRLERWHGEQLVRRASAILCVSRGGATDHELLSLLARDGRVLRETAISHPQPSSSTPSYPSVPFVLWARLRRDLGNHLTEVETDGTWVVRWRHRELASVAAQRYLKTADSRMAVHADFADYYRGSSSDTSRGCVFQPLAWACEQGGRTSYVFNLRKLHGLPHHLARSGQILPMLSECLFNYEFLLHKVWGLSILHVEEDLKAAVLPDKELLDVTVLSQTLELSRSTLLQDPCQLASQLLGRLHQIIAQDKPVAPGDPCRYSYLHALLAQCQRSSLPVLVPSFTCLLPPGGLTHKLLAGHMNQVTALAGGQTGLVAVSCSMDGALILWHLEKGTTGRALHKVADAPSGMAPDSLALCLHDSLVALTTGPSFQVRELDSGKVLYSESESLDVPIVTSTSDGQLLVVFYDGSHLVKIFDLAASCALLHRRTITLEPGPLHKDRSILVSRHSVKDYVLFAYRSGEEAAVLGAKGGAVIATLKAQHPAASIQAVEMTAQYILLLCRYPYKRHGEIVHIELFSTATFGYLRSILGCGQDSISHVCVTRGGSHIVAFCPSPHNATTEIIIWNLETEDHKHMACFPGLLVDGLCGDLRFCLGFCAGERYLRVWNLASRINDQTLTYNVHRPERDGTAEVVPMGSNSRYVVCRSLRTGTVRVWNVGRVRFRSRPVRVQHGLFSSSDVVLVRELQLYVLTDRGTATFTDTSMTVYKTLLVYDLLKRSYTKRRTGLFIVPCPQSDYQLLQGELLLGLSETRDHLIVWDLESGYIKGRIKTSHRESLLSSTLRDGQLQIPPAKESTGLVMPWDRRMETHTAKRRRLERERRREKEEQQALDREKHNSIDQYLLSGDQQVAVCSYFAHHLSVFDVTSLEHLHTLEDRGSLLALRTAALSHSGGHLVLANYSQAQRTSYLTLWDVFKGAVGHVLVEPLRRSNTSQHHCVREQTE